PSGPPPFAHSLPLRWGSPRAEPAPPNPGSRPRNEFVTTPHPASERELRLCPERVRGLQSGTPRRVHVPVHHQPVEPGEVEIEPRSQEQPFVAWTIPARIPPADAGHRLDPLDPAPGDRPVHGSDQLRGHEPFVHRQVLPYRGLRLEPEPGSPE